MSIAVLVGGFATGCGSAPASGGRGGSGAGSASGAGGVAGSGGVSGAAGCNDAAGAGGAGAGVGPPDADALTACAACELGSAADSCDATFLSGMRDASGNPVGWGVATLAEAAARAAGAALLHCLNVHGCAANADNSGPGNNPELGCFCGSGVSVADCISGAGIHGACLVEYEAAATATPTGPAACSPLAVFAGFVATVTSNPKSPIGIANSVKRCAIDAPCPICDTL